MVTMDNEVIPVVGRRTRMNYSSGSGIRNSFDTSSFWSRMNLPLQGSYWA